MGLLDRWTKKATVNAIETTRETLNDKYGQYIGLAKLGITLGIFIFGGKKINHYSKNKGVTQAPQALPNAYPQQPIVINNYYDRGYIPNGRQKNQPHKKY